MGKYYSRHGCNLYIYVTQDDAMIDLGLFPSEMNLFDTEAVWRIKDKMAVVNEADETNLDKAEIILSLNSFKRLDHPEELLEQYFTLGDESLLGEKVVVAPETAPAPAEEPRLEEMVVIIPGAIAPPPGPQTVAPKGEDEVVIPPSVGRTVEPPIPKRDEPSQIEMDLTTEQMTNDIKEFTNKTYSSYSDDVGQSLADWLNQIEAHWKKLEPILEMIAASPHYTRSTRKVKKKINELEDVDLETIDSIMKELNELENLEERGAFFRGLISGLPIRVSVEEKHTDYDVVENRVLKTHLDALESRIRELFELAQTRDRFLRIDVKRSEGEATVARAKEFLANHEIMGAFQRLKGEIEGKLKGPELSFLVQLEQHTGSITPTQTFSDHPHYSKFYTNLESYEESAPPLPMRFEFNVEKILESSSVYAMWCMIKILEALLEFGYKLKLLSLTRSTGDEAGLEEGVIIVLTGRDSEVRVAYEKLYVSEPPYGSYSTPRKATLALEVFEADLVPRVIIFEPRYDFDYSAEKFEVEDLDKLHVLCDSLVDLRDDERERIGVGGFVLHPTPTETVRYGNLAAISLKPGATADRLLELLKELFDVN